VTALLVAVAARLRVPVPGPSASGGAVAFLVVAWLLAIAAFPVDAVVYGMQAHRVHLDGFFCACAGPMVFELPFDLIVLTRTTAIPPAPRLYVALFFLPLLAIEVLTLALAVTRSGARVTRGTLLWLAGMFAVFSVWALTGFEYPWGGLPLTMNIASKILAFVVALSLFARREDFEGARSRG
jgi:hypothetical protein